MWGTHDLENSELAETVAQRSLAARMRESPEEKHSSRLALPDLHHTSVNISHIRTPDSRVRGA